MTKAELTVELHRCDTELAYCEAQIRAGAPPYYGDMDRWWLWMVGYGDNWHERRLILEELDAATRREIL